MNLQTGGWGQFRDVTQEELTIFEEAMNGLVGVGYEPILVATQVVSGINYSFICVTTIMSPTAPKGLAKVIIHQGLGEAKPFIKAIEPIEL